MTSSGGNDHLNAVVHRACRVVAHGGVCSITVIAGRSFRADELTDLRLYAAGCGVALTVDGSGAVMLRAGSMFRRERQGWWRRILLAVSLHQGRWGQSPIAGSGAR